MTVTRRKRIKDPLTGEVVGMGPKEIYAQERRDYNEHPLTEAETRQRAKWRDACRLAPAIVRDTSHPRYMEFYRRWKEHVQTSESPMPFLNFVRAVLIREV